MLRNMGEQMDELRELLNEFIAECQDILERIRGHLLNFGLSGDQSEQLKDVMRGIHTIKGSASMFELKELTQKAHKLETFLQKFKDKPESLQKKSIDSVLAYIDTIEGIVNAIDHDKSPNPPQSLSEDKQNVTLEEPEEHGANDSANNPPAEAAPAPSAITQSKKTQDLVRVPVERIQRNLDTVTEIFLIRNQMSYLVDNKLRNTCQIDDFLQEWDALDNALRKSVSELEHLVMGMRLMPIKNLFQRMEKAVRTYLDTSTKKIKVDIIGENTELDKKILDHLAEPLIHLIRNAMDHGIENCDTRKASGKSETGKIRLSAEVRGNEVLITIGDDGKGLDGAAILESARNKGFPVSHIKSADQAVELIFLPGFSTSDSVSDVSGRGVGMDAVKTFVEGIGGRISIATEIGKGTTFSLVLPLGMSLIPTILTRINRSVYAFSSSDIVETLEVHSNDVRINGKNHYIKYKSQLIRTFFLEKTLSVPSKASLLKVVSTRLPVCIVQVEDEYFALVVGEFLSNTEIAAKILPVAAPKIPYVTSASILVTGEPVLVISTRNLCGWLQDKLDREATDVVAA